MLSDDQLERIEAEQNKFPNPKTSIIHALFIAQEEKNYVLEEDVDQMADVMDIDASDIWSVASFYTMINQEQVGRFKIQICHNLSCMIEGADEILDYLESRLGIEEGETTPDELFTLEGVECLGSCGTGPVCQVNDRPYRENMDTDDVDELLEKLREKAEKKSEPTETEEVVES
jgi:NADH-quinone oxidoreductase subunit E